MVRQDIIEYLREGKTRGFGLPFLQERLLAAGFPAEEVQAASAFVGEEKIGLFSKLGRSFVLPRSLFLKTKGESHGQFIYYYIIALVLYLVLGLYLFIAKPSTYLFSSDFLELFSPALADSALFVSVLQMIFLGSALLLLIPVFMWFSSIVYQGMLKVLGSGEAFYTCTKSMLYGCTPLLLIGSVLFMLKGSTSISGGVVAGVFGILVLWSFSLVSLGLYVQREISLWKVIVSSIVVVLLLGVIGYGLYASGASVSIFCGENCPSVSGDERDDADSDSGSGLDAIDLYPDDPTADDDETDEYFSDDATTDDEI